MKMLNLSMGLLVVLIFTSSCSDFLENPTPAQSLDAESAFTTAADIQTALIGTYNALQTSDFGSTGLAINDNVLSDNAEWRGSFPSYVDMFNRQLTPDNGEVEGLWEAGYEVINSTSLILRALDNSNDPALTADVANDLRGQALFLRGLSYFELTRAFAQPYGASSSADIGIPIVTEGTLVSGEITFPARATVEESYNQAISDLTEAQNLLDNSGIPYFASSLAATAVLADIAFQQRDYARAAQLANTVIESDAALAASPEEPFVAENSAEIIFAVSNTVQDNPGVNGSLATFHHINGRGGDVIVNQDLLDNGYNAIIPMDQQDEAGDDDLVDLRFALLTSSADPNVINVEKYEDFANNADDNIIARVATYYLMRAEALVRTGGDRDEAIELLNAVRTRAIVRQDADGAQSDASDIVGFEADDFDNDDDLLEAIILERRVELAFERNRLNDLRRLMRDVRGLPFDDPSLVFPIPQRDLDANDQLVQNPGY